MESRRKRITAIWLMVATLSSALSCAPGTVALQSATPREVVALVDQSERPEQFVRIERAQEEERIANETKAETTDSVEPTKRVVRRIKGSEMNVAVVKKARSIINEHYKKPFGFEVEFEIDGTHYVGRIEPHYHPPGGKLRPWGHHAGCSLYVVEQG